MELQIEGGSLSGEKNLVLYLYCAWKQSDAPGDYLFVSKVYEGAKDDPIGCKLPLFHCRGAGDKDFSDALALLDILLGRYRETSLRGPLETWLLESQTAQAESFKLCIEVRNQGRNKKVILPAFRFPGPSQFHRTEWPTRS